MVLSENACLDRARGLTKIPHDNYAPQPIVTGKLPPNIIPEFRYQTKTSAPKITRALNTVSAASLSCCVSLHHHTPNIMLSRMAWFGLFSFPYHVL